MNRGGHFIVSSFRQMVNWRPWPYWPTTEMNFCLRINVVKLIRNYYWLTLSVDELKCFQLYDRKANWVCSHISPPKKDRILTGSICFFVILYL